MYKIKTTVLFIVITCSSFAQTMISGKVIDSKTRQPLEAASIHLGFNESQSILTDKEGYFLLKLKASVTNKLTASYIGYKNDTINIANKNPIIIELEPTSATLSDLILSKAIGQQKFINIAKVDIEVRPVKNTQELMRMVPGLLIAQHAGGGKAEQIFLRGFDCDHGTDIQVSVDGIPVNMVSHAHGQGYADAHFIIPETIDKIDYGTGPYYAQQGNLNTAGYVSFSTFRTITQSRVQMEIGNFNSYRGLVMLDLLKGNKDKQSAFIASEINYTDGPTINAQNFNRFNVLGKYNATFSSSWNLTLTGSAFKSKWDASGQVPNRAVEAGIIDRFGSIDPTEGGTTERYNVNVQLSKKLKNGLLLEQQAFYSRYLFSLYSNFTFFVNDAENGDEINQAEKRNTLGYNTRLSHSNTFDKWTLKSFYGGGFRYDAIKDSYLANVVKRQFLGYKKHGDIKEANAFAYMQQQAITGKWVFEAGVRFDYLHFDYFDKLTTTQLPTQGKAIVCPKINIQYNISKNVQLYVKTGRGFHSNDTRVVTANEGRQSLPAAYGTDLGIAIKPTKDILLSVAAWKLYLDQEFVYVGDDGNIEPSGKTKRQGIDILARYQISNNLYANANINFTKSRAINEPKGADFIPLAPSLTSTGGIFYKKKTGLNGGISYRFIKDRPANEDNSIIAKGYLIMDGCLNYSMPKYELGFAIENLLNREWNEAQFATESRLKDESQPITELNFTPGTPFSFRLKLAVFF